MLWFAVGVGFLGLSGCGSTHVPADDHPNTNDPPLLVPWSRVGDITLGGLKSDVEQEYGPQGRGFHVVQRYGNAVEGYYRLYGGTVAVTFYGDRVGRVGFGTPYYRTKSGFGVGSTIPLGPCHRTATNPCEHRWRGFIYNVRLKEDPCIGLAKSTRQAEDESIRSVAAAITVIVVLASPSGAGSHTLDSCRATWRVVHSDPEGFLTAVSGSTADNVWAVGEKETKGAHRFPLVEHWKGGSWSVVAAPSIPRDHVGTLAGVAALAPDNVWAVGSVEDHPFADSSALLAHWDGTGWTRIAPPLPKRRHASLDAIVATAAGDVWVFGVSAALGPFEDPSHPDRVFGDHFDGRVWTMVLLPVADTVLSVVDAAASSSADGWLVVDAHGGPGNNYAVTAHWDGTRWRSVDFPNFSGRCGFEEALTGVSALASDDVWTVGYGECRQMVRHWDGTAWRTVTTPQKFFECCAYVGEIAAASSGDVFVVGTGSGRRKAIVERSSGASTWHLAAAFRNTRGFGAVTALTPDDVWAVGPVVAHYSCG